MNIEKLKAKIQEANPEKMICEHCNKAKPNFDCGICFDACEEDITLADVLIAIKNKHDREEDKDLLPTQVNGLLTFLNKWNLKENFDNQSSELYEFLEKILLKGEV